MRIGTDPAELPAGLGWRIGARLVDVVVFTWLVAFVVVEIDQRLLGGDPLGVQPGRLALDSARPIVLTVVLAVCYEILPNGWFGATAGKAMFGLRVRPIHRAVPMGPAATVRAVLLYGPVLFLGPYGGIVVFVLFVSVAVPADGRGVHDRIAGTVVVGLPSGDDG